MTREATRRNSSCVACSSRVAIASSRSAPTVMPSSRRQLALEAIPAKAERTLAAGCDIGLEKLDVRFDRARGLGRRIGKVAEQVQIAEIGKRAGQIVVDEAERAAQALEPDLDEDARRRRILRILEVVARGLHESRNLAELREDAARAFGERRVVEERLSGQAGRQRVGKELRAAFPGPHASSSSNSCADARFQCRPLQPLDVGQARRIDRRQPPGKPAERPNLRVNRGSAEVLEQVIVQVDAVEGGRRGVDVEVRQYSSTKGKGFG